MLCKPPTSLCPAEKQPSGTSCGEHSRRTDPPRLDEGARSQSPDQSRVADESVFRARPGHRQLRRISPTYVGPTSVEIGGLELARDLEMLTLTIHVWWRMVARTGKACRRKKIAFSPIRAALDPELAANQAQLRHVEDTAPGITRQKARNGFDYRSPDGMLVRDVDTLKRIRSLAIPPAWAGVWICLNPQRAFASDWPRRAWAQAVPLSPEMASSS